MGVDLGFRLDIDFGCDVGFMLIWVLICVWELSIRVALKLFAFFAFDANVDVGLNVGLNVGFICDFGVAFA